LKIVPDEPLRMVYTMLIVAPILLYLLFPMSNKPIRYVLAFAVALGVYLLFWQSTNRSYQLEKYGRHATGIVLSKRCEGKSTQIVSYKFKLEEKEFFGQGKPGRGNQSCNSFHVGDQIFITYLGSNPDVNTPEREVDSPYIMGALATIGLFGLLIWGKGDQERFMSKKRKKKSKKK
jgi:hypothetical protein